MPKVHRYSIHFAVCLALAACTDDHSTTTPNSIPEEASSAVAAASPDLTLKEWTGSFEGLAKTELCSLDAVNGSVSTNGTFTVQANQPVTLEGWVSTTNLQTPPDLSIVLDGDSDFQIMAATGVARDDVAKAYGSTQLALAGFKADAASLAVPAGRYSVVLEHDEDGTSVICDTKLHIIATNPDTALGVN